METAIWYCYVSRSHLLVQSIISSIVKSTTELLLNSSNVLLFLWVEYIDDFGSGSDVPGVAQLLVICGMKEFLSLFDFMTYYPWEN